MLRSICIAAAALLLAGFAAMAAVVPGPLTVQATLRKQLETQPLLQGSARSVAVNALLPLTANQTWQQAVSEQNAQNVPLDTIKEINTSWDAAEDELPIQRVLVSNACAQAAIKVLRANPAVRQIFVLDNQGASVCQSELNKPYWQGERANWKHAYAGGKGGVLVEPVRFDETANAKLQDVSLPVIGSSGQIIGAVTFGIAVDTR